MRRLAKKEVGVEQPWQVEAWVAYDDTPEVLHAVNFRADQLQKVRWYVAARPDDGPLRSARPVTDEGVAVDPKIAAQAVLEFARLQSLGDLIHRASQNLDVTGEFFLLGFAATTLTTDGESQDTPERWLIASRDEISNNTDQVRYRRTPVDTEGPIPTSLTRCWLKHPRWAAQASCAMRPLLGDCRALGILSRKVIAEAQSGLTAGLLLIPNELDLSVVDNEGDDPDNEAPGDKFMRDLESVLIDPAEDPSSPASVVPGVVRGPAEYLKEVRHLKFDRGTGDQVDRQIVARVDRIARGLAVPVEVVEGHGNTTFANANQIDEDTFSKYLDPTCLIFADMFLVGFLYPQLLEAGFKQEELSQVVIGYDPIDLIATPDVESHSGQAHDRYAISDEAYRRATGFSEEDAPTPIELAVRHALTKGSSAEVANLLGTLAPPNMPVARRVTWTIRSNETVEPPPPPTEDVTTPAAALVASVSPLPIGTALARIDTHLRTALQAAASAAMGRALQLGANRLRVAAREHKAVLDPVPLPELGRVLKAVEPKADLLYGSGLFVGAWKELAARFDALIASAQDQVVAVVEPYVPLDSLIELRTVQQERRVDAVEKADLILTVYARELMFGPPRAPSSEDDVALLVDMHTIRLLVSIVGEGQGDLCTGAVYGHVGPLLQGAGFELVGWKWEYGSAYRSHHHDGHRALDGTGLSQYVTGWDRGCLCTLVPVLVPVLIT